MTLVLDLPVEHLATTLAPLRGPRTDPTSPLAPLPLRVAAIDDGTYEVLDGFKRLAAWTRDGHTHVPAVIEDAPGVVRQARLLEANAPRRTLSPMDEARVVRSLADDDPLTSAQIAKLLGRGRGWVDRRLTLARRLAPALAAHLDDGRLSGTTAHALTAFPRAEQPRHGLRTRETEAFLAAWRVAADDAVTREARLRDPRGAGPAPRDPAVSPLGTTAQELQARFDQTERALAELLHLDFTGFTDPECRVLEACQRRLAAQVVRLASTVQEETTHADSRGTRRTPPPPARAHPDPRYRPTPRPGRQDDQGDRHRLALSADLDPQGVVGSPARAAPGLALEHVHGAGCLLAADQILRPPASVERRVDELGASLCLTKRHAGAILTRQRRNTAR
jgi:ParB/RepB/Spo0J family partition protein